MDGATGIITLASPLDYSQQAYYSLIAEASDPDGTFSIDSMTGAISLASPLDYQMQPSYSLTAQVADADGNTDTATVDIVVEEVAQAPVFSQEHYFVSVPENTEVGTVVLIVIATNPQCAVITYSLLGGDGTFEISSSNGQISLAEPLDYEGTSYYSLTVQASDPEGNTSTATVTVDVQPNQAPHALDDYYSVGSDAAGTALALDVLANDWDLDDDP